MITADFSPLHSYVRNWDTAVAVALAIYDATGQKQRVRSLPTGGWTYEAAA